MLPPYSVTASHVGIEVAVETKKACGVFLLGKSFDLYNVPFSILAVRTEAEGDLIVEVSNKPKGLKVAVELVNASRS